ncbi:MAG: hypothetical protein WDW36_002797 [Sanguina aurantia]
MLQEDRVPEDSSVFFVYMLGICRGYPYRRVTVRGFELFTHANAIDDDITELGLIHSKHQNHLSQYHTFYKEVVCNGTDPCSRHLAVDVGAYVGSHALYMAKLGMEVHAFEPHEPSAALLACAVEENGMAGAVHVVREGLGAAVGEACMLQPRSQLPQWSTIIQKSTSSCDKPSSVVHLSTLDLYWQAQLQGRQIDVLKIDAEGYEYHILDGARQLMRDAPPPFILLEYHPRLLALKRVDASMLLNLAAAAHYRVYDCQSKKELKHLVASVGVLEAYRHSDRVTDLLLVRRRDFPHRIPPFSCAYHVSRKWTDTLH